MTVLLLLFLSFVAGAVVGFKAYPRVSELLEKFMAL